MWSYNETTAISTIGSSSSTSSHSSFGSSESSGQTSNTFASTNLTRPSTLLILSSSALVLSTEQRISSERATLYDGDFDSDFAGSMQKVYEQSTSQTAIGTTRSNNSTHSVSRASSRDNYSTYYDERGVTSISDTRSEHQRSTACTTSSNSSTSSIFWRVTLGSFSAETIGSTQYETGYVGITSSTERTSVGGTFTDSATGDFTYTTTYSLNQIFSYRSTTTTSTSAITTGTTTTSTRQSDYPVSGSTTGATETSSSADTYTTSTTTAETSTYTTYATTNYTAWVKIFTIIEAEESDWPWIVTDTAIGVPTVVADSFTKTTFNFPAVTSSVIKNLLLYTDGTTVFSRSTVTQTIPTFSQTTTTSTVRTTTSSTYQLGAPTTAIASLSYTATESAGITYLTSRATTFTFTSSTSTTRSFTILSLTAASSTYTNSSSFSTTYSGGTSLTTKTWTYKDPDFEAITLQNISSSLTTTFTIGVTNTNSTVNGIQSTTQLVQKTAAGGISSVDAVRSFQANLSTVAAVPAFTEITIGPGFQMWPDLGRLQPIGTNVVPNFSFIIPRANFNYGATLKTPELYRGTTELAMAGFSVTSSWDSAGEEAHVTYQTAAGTVSSFATVSLALAGALPSSLKMSHQQTSFGGYGWDATVGTSFTASEGVHVATIVDSSSFTTTEISWSAGTTSFALTDGQAIALQAVPLVASQSSESADQMFLNWPRFPVT